MAALNERTFAVDTLIANKVTADPSNPNASLQIISPTITLAAPTTGGASGAAVGTASPLTGSLGVVVYSKFTGTPFLLASASATNQVMDQFTLPANVLTTGHVLRFTVYGVHAADTNAGVVQVTFGSATGAYQTTISGGTSIGTSGSIAVSGGAWYAETDLFQSAASVQRSSMNINPGGTAVVANVDTSLTQDMTASKVVTLALQTATSAASCTIYGWNVVLL